MQSDPNIPLSNDKPQPDRLPPHLPSAEPPVIGAPPVLAASPAPLMLKNNRSSRLEHSFAILLSLCLVLFLAEAFVALADDSLTLLFDIRVLAGVRGTLFFLALLMAAVIYVLMGLTPMIPKRVFLPVTLFNPVAVLIAVPLMIFFFSRIQQIAWGISCCQVVFGLAVLYYVQGGFKLRWPLVAENQIPARRFSWRNLGVFLLANVFVVVPALLFYGVVCAALAIDHFTEGFLLLRPAGLTVQVRKYVRDDGKTIQLFPMAHVAEREFYRRLSESFPTNAIILMEGVTDNRNLLTNKITYEKAAATLGLAEQQKEFKPRGTMVRADVDIAELSKNTIDLLNVVMLIHSKGLNAESMRKLMQYSPPPHFEKELFADLLGKRNRHLLKEIQSWLPQSENIIVPWGVAHMPEIAKEIQKAGFRLDGTEEYVAIRFSSAGN